MSKSKGNVIYADDLVDIFGVDAVRYFLIHEMPYENDGVLSWELLVERINSDLANTVGNLVKRTIAMTNKYFDGVVEDKNVVEDVDADFKAVITGTRDKVEEKMEGLHVADALTEVINLFKRCNKYIDETEPWVLAKDEEKADRLKTVLYNLTEGINIGAALLKAFLPDTSKKILEQINTTEVEYDNLDTFGHYPNGNKVTAEPEILFERLKLEDIMVEAEKIKAAQMAANGVTEEAEEAAAPIEHKEYIGFEEFEKLELRTGKVISCEPVPKSSKLLCFQIQSGSEKRQIVSGIKKYYKPEELVGQTVVFVANMKPAKLAGVLSEGMILSAEDSEGGLSVVTTQRPVKSGAEVL
jgi:methionyl-tRNA synthetase